MLVLISLLACAPKQTTTNNASTARGGGSKVVLDGREISVTWQDGDTFSYTVSGDSKNARLLGFNTLESYGPVHRWGSWSKRELLNIANEATDFVKAETWECSTVEGSGGYNRNLIDCPGLRRKLIRQGLAHVYYLNNNIPAEILTTQQSAIIGKRGMWAKGAPANIVTSLHSRTEDLDGGAYNRVCSTETGRCMKRDHNERYEVCQTVEVEDSAMVYVPYDNRYQNKPDCL